MNGVTIMSEILCHERSLKDVLGTGIFTSTLMLLGIFVYWRFLYPGFKKSCTHPKDLSIAKTFLAMFSLFFIVLTIIGDISLYRQYHNTHMEYEIVIDDSVRFNDVMSTYEILDHYKNEGVYRVKLLEEPNG